jgi:signal transduction histidine kinase
MGLAGAQDNGGEVRVMHRIRVPSAWFDRGDTIEFELPRNLTFATVRDYENYIARLRGFDAYAAGNIELLREGLRSAPKEQLEELVLSLERGTLRLTRLIDNLLESVRIESGQIDVRRQSIELADVVEDARALVEALLRQRRQPLEASVPAGLELQGDGTRLTQVFVNLIANASKFAPEGTPVRVGARAEGNQISAWVEDSGPGLPDGDVVSIFERFKRGGTQEPEPGGLGLGLWISRSIVERHGGSITAARTDEGYTRFTITLPIEPTA